MTADIVDFDKDDIQEAHLVNRDKLISSGLIKLN